MEQGRNTSLRFSSKGNKLIPRDISESLGKLPPQALDLEEAVLGAIMLERNAFNTAISSSLFQSQFYDDRHKEIYTAMMELFAANEPIDMRTVVNQLRKMGKIDMVGGAYYIAELTSKVSSAANIEHHIRIVQEMFLKRSLIEFASEIHHNAYEDTTDVFALMDKASTTLFNMDIGRASQRKILDMVTLLNQAVTNLQKKTTHNGLTGIETGFQLLDRITSGWQNSDLILVAARPGAGKSAFMLSIARHASRQLPTAIFSLEMSAGQLADRLISADNMIENDKIRSGILSSEEWARIGSDPGKLAMAKLFIDDTPSLSIHELRSKCLRLKQERDLKMIVIDYLQLMRGESGGNREQEIASISRALKNLAKELDIPVIALSQLSRAVEQRADKRPMLSDLRESGSLEQDPDVVIFLYRPEYYKIMVDEHGNSTAGICEVDVAKHRNGGTGMVRIRFQKYFTKFVDLENDTLFGNDQISAPKNFISKHQYDPSEPRKKDEAPPPGPDDQPF